MGGEVQGGAGILKRVPCVLRGASGEAGSVYGL